MRQYLKSKHMKRTIIIIMICLIAVLATIFSISKSNARKEEVKSLVRGYDLTTEENSSATLIVKKKITNKKLEELGAEQIIKYGEYKVVKFSSQEEMEESLIQLQEEKEEVEVDALIDVATEIQESKTAEKTAEKETTPSTPDKNSSTLQQYLEANPSTKEVIVAIIDTGIDKENKLFEDRIIDTQLNYSTTGEEKDITDDNGHGTTIAEIIAKKTDSNVKLMPIKVANENGKSTILSVYMAINEAISKRADVINISMNTFSQSGLLREAIDKANDRGIKVVVSSGNLGIDVKNVAPSNIESAIVVGAVHSNLEYEGFSNYGEAVDYCSYGVYDSSYGTSISAAHISAVIAALESSGVAPADIESTMDKYIQDLGEAGKDKYYGKGFISLYNADECFTTDVDEEARANASKRKEMLQKLLNADWKSMTNDELNTLIYSLDYDIIGYFLKTLSQEDFNEITSRETVLKDPISVGTAFVITDVAQIEGVNWPDLPDKDYAHTYEYCLSLCDDSVSTSDDNVDEWILGLNGSRTAKFYVTIGECKYIVSIVGLEQPSTFSSTVSKGDFDNWVKNIKTNINSGQYTIVLDKSYNKTDLYNFGNKKKNYKGAAYILSEAYGTGNTAKWQGVYIRKAKYDKPEHCMFYEGKASGTTLGRLNTGYITSTQTSDGKAYVVKGNTVCDELEHEDKGADVIDIECNSYNCELASLGGKEAPANPGATLNIVKETYKTKIVIDPNGGKINKTAGGSARTKKAVTYKKLSCGESFSTKTIETKYNPQPTNSKYEFVGWKITCKNTNTKACADEKHCNKSIHASGIDCTTVVCSSKKDAEIILKAQYKKNPSPKPSDTPGITSTPDGYNTLNVNYLELNNINNVVANSYSETVTIPAAAEDLATTAVHNSYLVSADLYPSTYTAKRAITGYTYNKAIINASMALLNQKLLYNVHNGGSGSATRCINDGCSPKSKKDYEKAGYCYGNNNNVNTPSAGHSFIIKDNENNDSDKYKYPYKASTVAANNANAATHYEIAKSSGTMVLRPLSDASVIYRYNNKAYVYRVSNHCKYDLAPYCKDNKDKTTFEYVPFDLGSNTKFNIRNTHSSGPWVLQLFYTRNEYDLVLDPNGGKLNPTMALDVTWGTKYRYMLPRRVMNTQNYYPNGDTNPQPYGLGTYPIGYVNPIKDGYELDTSYAGSAYGWTHDGDGVLSLGSDGVFVYTPSADDTGTVTLTAQWKPKNYNLILHTRAPKSEKPVHKNSEDTILTGVTQTTNADGKEVQAYSEVDTYSQTYTYDDEVTFCIGDGRKQEVIDGFVTPYCNGYELVGFSTDPNSYEPDITNITSLAVDGVRYWTFDGHLDNVNAGDVHLYPIWEEKPWKLTVDTRYADQKLSDINVFESVDKNCGFLLTHTDGTTSKCDEILKAEVVDDWVFTVPFWYDETGSKWENTTTIQDTAADPNITEPGNKQNAIKTKLTKYGYYLPSDIDRNNRKFDWIPFGYVTATYTMAYNGTDYITYKFNNNYNGDMSLYANWQPNSHTLTIDGNGGTYTLSDGNERLVSSREFYYSEDVQYGLNNDAYDMTLQNGGAITEPKRYGYDFIGWKIVDKGENSTYKGRGCIRVVDADGEIIDSKDYYVDELVKAPASNSGEYYYIYTSEPNPDAGNDGYNWDGDVTIEAQWEPHKHTLTVDNNGGRYKLNNDTGLETENWSKVFTVGVPIDFATTSTSQYIPFTQLGIQSAPIRYGYTFHYWKADPLLQGEDLDNTIEIQEIEKEVDSKTKHVIETLDKKLETSPGVLGNYTLKEYMSRYDGDVTIQAQWFQNLYSLTVDPNGGTFYRPSDANNKEDWTTEPYTRKFIFGKETTFSSKSKDAATYTPYSKDTTNPYDVTISGAVSEPYKRGYTLTGWKEPLNNEGKHITTNDINEPIQNKVVDTDPSSIENGYWRYTADYAGDVTISAIWNNGQTTGSGDPYGNAYTIKYEKGLTDCSDDRVPTPNPQSANYDLDVTLHTKGDLLGRSYNINLDNGLDKGGTGLYIAEDNEYRDVSTRDTYKIESGNISGNLEFESWAVQKETDKEIEWALNAESGKEYKLYEYEIVNYKSGETVKKANFTSVPDGQVKATAKYTPKKIVPYTPSMEGYEFKGWYTEPQGPDNNGTKVEYIDILEDTNKYDITLYAHWEPIKYNIRYNGNGNWNLNQKAYTQQLTFDKPEKLIACKFNRKEGNPGYVFKGDNLLEGYDFMGWAKDGTKTEPHKQVAIGTNIEITYTDQAEGIFNLTSKKGDIIDFYAIWRKDLSVAFDLTGGYYDGETKIDTLEAYIWNSTYEYTFDITKYFGTVIDNGLNSKLAKTDADGNIYRFLGWSTNANAKVPDSNLVVYDSNRDNKYTIHDDKTLYAVWEKILIINYDVGRTKGEQDTDGSLPTILSNIKNITAITNNPSAAVVIKPGEQGYYKLDIAGTPISANTVFSKKVTDIYSNEKLAKWKDSFNQPDTESKAYDTNLGITTHTSGLNKQLTVSRLIKRNFHVPVYYADAYDESFLTFQHTVKQESFYYKYYVTGKDKEEITITTVVYVDTDNNGDDIPSTLDELKSLIKTKIIQ